MKKRKFFQKIDQKIESLKSAVADVCAENRKTQMAALQLFEAGKLGLGEMGTGQFHIITTNIRIVFAIKTLLVA
jgi:hypothetical protein